jgi:pimeloyl-ACP methyl ester carboxylesterase
MRVESEHHGGSGEPLLLLHGFTDTWRAWTPLLPRLEAVHEVLAPTLPGHHGGDELPPDQELTVEATADAIEERMDAAGWPTAHIAGNSFGGWLALELAARGRARSVVALCPAGGWEHNSPQGTHIYRYFMRSHRSLHLLTPAMLRAFAARPRLRAFGLRELVSHPERVPPRAALDMMEGARGCSVVVEGIELARRENAFAELTGIACPVRIAYGERDWLIRWPSFYGRLQRMLPDAEYVGLPDCGHLPMWDDPELVVRTILEVTQETGDTAPPAAVVSPLA